MKIISKKYPAYYGQVGKTVIAVAGTPVEYAEIIIYTEEGEKTDMVARIAMSGKKMPSEERLMAVMDRAIYENPSKG
jgi:hypothetical protein